MDQRLKGRRIAAFPGTDFCLSLRKYNRSAAQAKSRVLSFNPS